MKQRYKIALVIIVLASACLSLYGQSRYWVASTTGDWSDPANWALASGGTPGASAPATGSVAIFDGVNGKNGMCRLTSNIGPLAVTVNGYSGTIDLNGYILSVDGSSTFATGQIVSTGMGTLALNAGLSVTFSGTTIGVSVTGSVNDIFFDGSVFNSPVSVNRTGPLDNYSNGGSTFNSLVVIENSGAGRFFTGSSSADTFNGTLELINSGASSINVGSFSFGTVFNGEIRVNCTSGQGIFFGDLVFGGCTLSDGNRIIVGSQGFDTGELRFNNFSQIGTQFQNFTLGGNALLRLGYLVEFDADVSLAAPGLQLDGVTFNGVSSLEKTGNGVNFCNGGNLFRGATTITNSGSGFLFMGWLASDTFEGDVTFKNTSGGTLQPSLGQSDSYHGNITVNSPNNDIIFSNGGGIVNLVGTGLQQINKVPGSRSPVIRRLTINKPSQGVTLGTDVAIWSSIQFIKGVVTSSPANFFNLIDNASTTGASNDSHVDGPLLKTGDDAFTFPIGGGGFYQPLAISAPGNVGDQFTAQYVHSSQSLGLARDASLAVISDCEYWMLDRTTGNSSVVVALSWQTDACPNQDYVTTLPDLRVARWDGTLWADQGNGGATGNAASGVVASSTSISSFAPWQQFTLASSTLANVLPIELLEFKATCTNEGTDITWKTASEMNNDFFTIESSADGITWSIVAEVPGAGNSLDEHNYSYLDKSCFEKPCGEHTYYRLKQTDYDGVFKFFKVISLNCRHPELFTVFPNPSNGSFKIAISGDLTYTIKVATSLGQVVYLGETHGIETEVLVPNLAAGLYLVTLSNAAGMKVLPILVR